MPKKIEVLRGFNFVPEGASDEVRVDIGDRIPKSLSIKQITRLIERGVLGVKHG